MSKLTLLISFHVPPDTCHKRYKIERFTEDDWIRQPFHHKCQKT